MQPIDFAGQIENLMPAIGLGFVLALFYDAVRIVRLFLSSNKVFVFITDILFCITCTICIYLLFLALTNGHIRFYLLLAVLVGAVVYACSLGEWIYPAAKRVSETVRRFLRRIFSPVRQFFRFLSGKRKKQREKLKKIFSKFQNNSKKTLKDDPEV